MEDRTAEFALDDWYDVAGFLGFSRPVKAYGRAARLCVCGLGNKESQRSPLLFSKKKKSASYLSQLCVQPFLFGHKLQFLIEKSFFLGFDDGLGVVSTRI